METIKLDELLMDRYHCSTESTGTDERAIQQVNRDRDRDLSMQKVLDPRIVRRLDTGFARSSTVHPDTGKALYSICYASGAQNVFETGTYWGFSTAYLASALKDKRGGKVYTFDTYRNAGKHIPKELLPYVEMHKGKPSTEMMPPVLTNITPEMFFQDSLHDYEGVKGELQVIAPHLPINSVVMFHDFINPEVRRAATEILSGFTFYLLDNADPQQIGVAINDGC